MKFVRIKRHEKGHCYAEDDEGHVIIANDEIAITNEDPMRLLIDLWDLGFVPMSAAVGFQGVWGSLEMEKRARQQYTAELIAGVRKRIKDLDDAVGGHGLRWPLPSGVRSDLRKLARMWPVEKS